MPGVDGRENRWAEPSPSDFDRWADLVHQGEDPGDAARQLGFRGSAQFGRTNPARHREVLEAWREQKQTAARTTGLGALLEIAGNQEEQAAARVSAGNTLVRIGGLLTDRSEVQL